MEYKDTPTQAIRANSIIGNKIGIANIIYMNRHVGKRNYSQCRYRRMLKITDSHSNRQRLYRILSSIAQSEKRERDSDKQL